MKQKTKAKYVKPEEYEQAAWDKLNDAEKAEVLGFPAPEDDNGGETHAEHVRDQERDLKQKAHVKDDPVAGEIRRQPVAMDHSQAAKGRSATEIATAAARGQAFPADDGEKVGDQEIHTDPAKRDPNAPPPATVGP